MARLAQELLLDDPMQAVNLCRSCGLHVALAPSGNELIQLPDQVSHWLVHMCPDQSRVQLLAQLQCIRALPAVNQFISASGPS